MPVVFTQNFQTADGHSYADVLGRQYEFPPQYRSHVIPGEPFVYYRGRRGAPKGEPPYAYIGVGVIGEVGGPVDGLYVAAVEDFLPFDEPLPFKENGSYIEDVPRREGSAQGAAFRGTSVRPISDDVYRRILFLAGLDGAALGPIPIPAASGNTYPTAQAASASDEAGMGVALKAAAIRWSGATIERMSHGNPGYDIHVSWPGGERFVEVKSTAGVAPVFFLSEGQRLFSERHADRFSLLVVTECFTAKSVAWRDGALNGGDLRLEPTKYRAQLI